MREYMGELALVVGFFGAGLAIGAVLMYPAGTERPVPADGAEPAHVQALRRQAEAERRRAEAAERVNLQLAAELGIVRDAGRRAGVKGDGPADVPAADRIPAPAVPLPTN